MKISRRKFIFSTLIATPFVAVADAKWLEPTWLKTSKLRIGNKTNHRFIYFTDLHYKGDYDYAQSMIKKINSLSPDFVCFGGDIVEEAKFLEPALEILSGIKFPMFGVPGNHDYWSKISFEPVKKCFASTGGAWLMDELRQIADDKINLIGITCNHGNQAMLPLNPQAKNILLMHYPAWVKRLDQKFDLMLAGHSHGGQVRIPFYGALVLPFNVDEYDLGLFETNCGPLYVGSGIGWFYLNARFNCRPEITMIEI